MSIPPDVSVLYSTCFPFFLSTSKVNCNSNNTATYLDSPCWDSHTITRRNVYRIYLVGFIALLLPMIYAGLKKTASIQVITIILRWLGTRLAILDI